MGASFPEEKGGGVDVGRVVGGAGRRGGREGKLTGLTEGN